jgi:hypothetical protein
MITRGVVKRMDKRNILGSTHAAYRLNKALVLKDTSAIDNKLEDIGERDRDCKESCPW